MAEDQVVMHHSQLKPFAAASFPLPQGEGLLGVGFYAEKRRDVMPANAGIQGEYAIVQG